jgi:hypothetical protein
VSALALATSSFETLVSNEVSCETLNEVSVESAVDKANSSESTVPEPYLISLATIPLGLEKVPPETIGSENVPPVTFGLDKTKSDCKSKTILVVAIKKIIFYLLKSVLYTSTPTLEVSWLIHTNINLSNPIDYSLNIFINLNRKINKKY